jgi:hypothetical protein
VLPCETKHGWGMLASEVDSAFGQRFACSISDVVAAVRLNAGPQPCLTPGADAVGLR